MDIEIIPPDKKLLTERAHVISMVIKSFKGRKDVEVHVFRPEYAPSEVESYDWDTLLGDQLHPAIPADPAKSRKVLLEAFTAEERDLVVDYLAKRYEEKVSRITAAPLDLPVPLGLPPLSEIPEGKTMGFIHFDRMPNYTLPFAIRGFYDLSQHEPLMRE